MTRRYTAKELVAVSCFGWRDRIRDEVPPEGITAREIIGRVDPWEARWPLIRLLGQADRKQLVLWCCDVAQDVRHLIADEEARDAVDLAIQTAVAWTEGAATQEDCRDAYAAADAYAYASTYAAAAAAASAAHAAAYAAHAAIHAAFAASYAVNVAFYADSATAAHAASNAGRTERLRGYLDRLVDRLEAIVPEHADAEKEVT